MQRKNKILQEGRKYTFRDYFELKYPTDEILMELGYEYSLAPLALPRGKVETFETLKMAMLKRLPHVSLNSEAARREFYLSPFMWDLLDRLPFRVNIEYSIEVNERLRGVIDYLLRSTQNLIVIEAKLGDMERGFTQLAVELIAVSQSLSDAPNYLYGAVTMGDVWRFGMLDVSEKIVYKDVEQFLMPQHIDEIASVIVGILFGNEAV